MGVDEGASTLREEDEPVAEDVDPEPPAAAPEARADSFEPVVAKSTLVAVGSGAQSSIKLTLSSNRTRSKQDSSALNKLLFSLN